MIMQVSEFTRSKYIEKFVHIRDVMLHNLLVNDLSIDFIDKIIHARATLSFDSYTSRNASVKRSCFNIKK